MVSESFVRRAHAIDLVVYKIEWCTKCRYKMFGKPWFAKACEQAIRQVAERHKLVIVELSVMPEHVHCIVRAFARYSLSYVTMLLKGGSSFLLFQRMKHLKFRYPRRHLWSAGKARSTLGVDLETARKYVTAPHNDRHQTKLTGYPNL